MVVMIEQEKLSRINYLEPLNVKKSMEIKNQIWLLLMKLMVQVLQDQEIKYFYYFEFSYFHRIL